MGRERGLEHPLVLLATVLATTVDVILTPIAYIVTWLESSLGWMVDLALAPLGLILAIPYVGRGLGWLLAVIQTLVWGVVALPDAILTWLGIMPEKRLRLVVLLPPQADTQTRTAMLQALDVAAQMYRREANVRLMPAVPWTFHGAFASPGQPADEWVIPGDFEMQAINVGCAAQAALEDIGRLGGKFAWRTLRHHAFGIARRGFGTGSPVALFAVRSVDEGRLAGCSLGPLTDYVTIRMDLPVCLAHELGHACNLLHVAQSGNLMNPTCGGVHLERWQVVLIRLSRHVSFL